jgi:hypothetical protein
MTDDEAAGYAEAVVSERMQAPDGPPAPLRSAAS